MISEAALQRQAIDIPHCRRDDLVGHRVGQLPAASCCLATKGRDIFEWLLLLNAACAFRNAGRAEALSVYGPDAFLTVHQFNSLYRIQAVQCRMPTAHRWLPYSLVL